MIASVAFHDVCFTYPGAVTRALDHVDAEIAEGTFALVTGPTASGKSTFLRAINGLVPHFSGGSFSGTVQVMGRTTHDASPRDLADVVAFVPQDPNASFIVDRVEHEVAYALENLAASPALMRRRVEEMLDLLRIEELRDRSVRSLSGGERQRVAIAAALAPGPRVLVLDEPTSQLDPQGAEDVLAALQRLVHDLGMTVVLAEHRLERVAGFADVAIGCTDGRVQLGEPREVLGATGAGPPVARLGRAAGWDPVPLTVREARRFARDVEVTAPAPSARPDGADPLLSATGVSAGYGHREVLRGIDVLLRPGEIVALMGRNGAGKSTLLRCLAGLHYPTAGSVALARARQPIVPGRDVALCPQAPDSVLFKETVLEEVETTARWSGSGVEARDLLRSLGIDADLASHPRDLSAGERLLVAIAATVATGARVVLLDEPTRGLDPSSKARLVAYVRSVAESGGAVVIATHDVELAAEVATRVCVLAGGELIADGDPADVLGHSTVFAPQMARVFGPQWLTPDEVLAHLAPSGATS